MVTSSILAEIVGAYFKNNNPGGQNWIYQNVFALEHIPLDKLTQIPSFKNAEKECPILMILGTPKSKDNPEGILLTDENLYCELRLSISKTNTSFQKYSLNSIKSAFIRYKLIGSELIINEKNVAYIGIPFKEQVLVINQALYLVIAAMQPIGLLRQCKDDSSQNILKYLMLNELQNYDALDEKEYHSKKKEILSRL